MDRDYLYYPGTRRFDRWILVYDDVSIEELSPLHERDSFSWNVTSKEIGDGELCVRIFSHNPAITQLPPFVHELSANIVNLEMPIRFVPFLKSSSIPLSVKTLGFSGTGRFEIPPSVQLPQIERIQAEELIFGERNFPELTSLTIKLDRHRTMLKRLNHWKKLKVLSIGPCQSDIFSLLSGLELGYLRLNNNHSTQNLEGIERISTITDLWIQMWTQLNDLTSLTQLPLLEELTISYCKRLQVVEPLLEIQNLKSLFIWQCQSKTLHQLVPELKKKGIEKLAIS